MTNFIFSRTHPTTTYVIDIYPPCLSDIHRTSAKSNPYTPTYHPPHTSIPTLVVVSSQYSPTKRLPLVSSSNRQSNCPFTPPHQKKTHTYSPVHRRRTYQQKKSNNQPLTSIRSPPTVCLEYHGTLHTVRQRSPTATRNPPHTSRCVVDCCVVCCCCLHAVWLIVVVCCCCTP